MKPRSDIALSKSSRLIAVPMLCLVIMMVTSPRTGVYGTVDVDTCRDTNVTNHLLSLNITHNTTVKEVSVLQHINYPYPNCTGGSIYSGEHHSTSSCPWHIQTHIDQWRIPREIRYVQCRCKFCEHRFNHNGYCKEVYQDLTVIRKYCSEDGTMTFRQEIHRFPVACVCVPRLPGTRLNR